MSNNKKIKPLIMLVLAFAMPVVLAKLYLSQSWYQGGVTNRGVLMAPAINFSELDMINPAPGKWQLIYQIDNDCMEFCQQQLRLMHQSFVALGRNQDRVKLSIFKPESIKIPKQVNVSEWQELAFISALSPLTGLPPKRLMIADPLGNIMMSYDLGSDPEGLKMINRDMLIDLRKLLKLSKVG
ncbi:hypothetical protein [Paraferrimonas sp. SM1919]|uniref:hypothetical protein n=1 Tax=Paraferrimonas sp. SM1919 TaxID=2662263 RepID=UPI0013D24AAC|nr:hypothetical protein [Paraferrimonas sp. SM1919]